MSYADPTQPVSRLVSGTTTYFIEGTPDVLAPLLERLGVRVDDLTSSPLSPHNGVIRVLTVSQLADRLEAARRAR